jgi:hypothetical protein
MYLISFYNILLHIGTNGAAIKSAFSTATVSGTQKFSTGGRERDREREKERERDRNNGNSSGISFPSDITNIGNSSQNNGNSLILGVLGPDGLLVKKSKRSYGDGKEQKVFYIVLYSFIVIFN